MDLGIVSSPICCDCGCNFSLNNAKLQIENECELLRETVSSLEQSIQDLYAELDEERNAASTSADESMSMIMRLQREKAEIQMELRQFICIAEEKIEHDEQELSSVEDLIYKREQTIQAYRHRMMSYGIPEAEVDEEITMGATSEQTPGFSHDFPSSNSDAPDVTKLYSRLKALEANRESMRQAIMSMRTEKTQMVLLKEISHHLSKDIVPQRRTPLQKAFRFISTLKWIVSFVFLRRKAQRSKHMKGMQASNIALQMLLEKNPRLRQWRCLSSTQV